MLALSVSGTEGKEKEMQQANKGSVIIKLDYSTEQPVGEIKKVVGLTKAKYLIPVIDYFNLESYNQTLSGFKMAIAGLLD